MGGVVVLYSFSQCAGSIRNSLECVIELSVKYWSVVGSTPQLSLVQKPFELH